MVKLRRCTMRVEHVPKPERTVAHHIWPQAMGGPDTAANKIDCCDNDHYGTHRALDDLLDAHAKTGKATRKDMVRGDAVQQRYAWRGYNEWVAAGCPGHPVYQLLGEESGVGDD